MAANLDFKMADSSYNILYHKQKNICFDTQISFLSLKVMKTLAKIETLSDGDHYHGNGGN